MFAYWWKVAKIAATGASSFANDWQWVYGNPVVPALAAIGFGTLGADGNVTLIAGHAGWNAAAVASIAFAITWLVGVFIRMPIVSSRLYYGEKSRADAAEERLKPKFELSFDKHGPRIADAIDRVRGEMGTSTQGQIINEYKSKYVRIWVSATGAAPVKGVEAYVTELRRKRDGEAQFINVQLPQPIALKCPQEVKPGVPQPIDFLTISERDFGPPNPAPGVAWPAKLVPILEDVGTGRFTIAVNGSDITQTITVDVEWAGSWDKISGKRV